MYNPWGVVHEQHNFGNGNKGYTPIRIWWKKAALRPWVVSLRLRLPLFPARTHADCSSNYKMEESPTKPEERPNGEAGRPQHASPSPKTRTRPKTIVAARSSKPDKNSQARAI